MPRTTPKAARPANWTASKWARANSRALTTIATGGGVLTEQGAQQQTPEEQLLDDRGAHPEEEQQHDDAADGVGGAGVALRRLAQLVAQVAVDVLEREVQERDQDVLAGQADGRADGQVPPAAEAPPVVAAQVALAADPAGDTGRRRSGRPTVRARRPRSPRRGSATSTTGDTRWRPRRSRRLPPTARARPRTRRPPRRAPSGYRRLEPPAGSRHQGGGRLEPRDRRATRRSTCVHPCGARRSAGVTGAQRPLVTGG